MFETKCISEEKDFYGKEVYGFHYLVFLIIFIYKLFIGIIFLPHRRVNFLLGTFCVYELYLHIFCLTFCGVSLSMFCPVYVENINRSQIRIRVFAFCKLYISRANILVLRDTMMRKVKFKAAVVTGGKKRTIPRAPTSLLLTLAACLLVADVVIRRTASTTTAPPPHPANHHHHGDSSSAQLTSDDFAIPAAQQKQLRGPQDAAGDGSDEEEADAGQQTGPASDESTSYDTHYSSGTFADGFPEGMPRMPDAFYGADENSLDG